MGLFSLQPRPSTTGRRRLGELRSPSRHSAFRLVERPFTTGSLTARIPGAAPPKALPPTLLEGPARILKHDPIEAAYHWRPKQSREHEQPSHMSYNVGTYVNTLTVNVGVETFEGAVSHMIRVERDNFTAKSSCWCHLVGDGFVLCRGTVIGVCPREHDPNTNRNMKIARLPVNYRPRSVLLFAAVSREVYDGGSSAAYQSHLVTLIVNPDGWIMGVSDREAVGAIDLSAIRFCTGTGIALVDEVSLHTCEMQGTRMVLLQGTVTERFFTAHSHKPLALLPESCRPPRELSFIVPGKSAGGFHLLAVNPSRGFGCGGDVLWRDSIWNHDRVNFTGIIYEVAEEALHISTLSSTWTEEFLAVFVKDFQNFLIRKFGSVEIAWCEAFDLDQSGSINFTEFGLGCKASGYVGNASRLWAALDEDRSGEISISELQTGLQTGLTQKRVSTLSSLSQEQAKVMPPRRLTLEKLLHISTLENIEDDSPPPELDVELPGMIGN